VAKTTILDKFWHFGGSCTELFYTDEG